MAIPDGKILSPLRPSGLIYGMGVEICFDGYLRSLISAYQQWWRLYTLTDATGRESQRGERDRIAPAFFDFGLMVQTVDKEKVESQKEKEEGEKEKIERLPVLEGICKYAAEHVLLVGRPGSGKSMALARLLLQEAENALNDHQQAKIPVLVELRYLPSEANESSVCDRIVAFMHKHDPALDINEARIKQLLRQGRLLLLVDGVNELPSDRGRVMVNQFRELYQKTCPMIFTTRELSAGGDLGIAKRLEMQPLTEPQMQQFVMAYLPTQGERLLRQLSGRLREFGQTPLLLWMLCSLFQHPEFKGQIPPNLGMVFRAFTVGYGDRIKQDVTLSKDSRAWWGRLLQYLAFKMTCGENLTELQVAISRRDAEQILVEFLREKVEYADDCAGRWLEDLLKHHLIQISNDRIEFRHQLIQEYYAAEWLLGLLPSLSDARLQQGYLNYLKWTEPLALMLELVEGEEQAVRVVRLALEVDLRLGARLAGAVKYGFQEKTVGLLLREIEEWEIPKLYAIELLGETRSDYASELLKVSLKIENHELCRKSVNSLENIRGEKADKILFQSLNSKDIYVRWKSAQILGNNSNDKAIEELIKRLYHKSPSVCKTAAEALGNVGSDKAVKTLIQALKHQNDDVCVKAAEALGKIGNDQAVEPLIQALKHRNEDVCEQAAEALGKIGSDQAVAPLVQALKDNQGYNDTCWKIAEALGKIGSDQAVDPLVHALKHKDRYVRRYAAEALGKIGNDKAVESLIQFLNHQNSGSTEYYKAVEALGKIVSDGAINLLIKVLKDKDIYTLNPYIRASLSEILGNIGSDKAIEPLIQVLKDKHSGGRWQAAEALGKIGSEKAIPSLTQALEDEDSYVRMYSAEALEKIGGGKIPEYLAEHLIQLKNDHKAVEVLGKIGSDKAIALLIQTLKDEDSYVRGFAAEVLGEIGGDNVVEPLIQSLKDKDSSVRKISANALGKTESEKSIESLTQSLKDLISGVRENAAKSLCQIAQADRNLPTLTQQLPHLLTLIPTEASQEALSVITAIQARCKYYNYDIAQTPLQEENNNDKVLSNPQGNIIHMTEINNNFSGANFGAANIANLGGTVNEQKIVQKTEVPKQNLAEATKEVQELLNQLAKTNPSEATIAETIHQEIKRNPTLKARLVNALKTGGIEALKAIFNNPLVSIPVETVKGFLEAES
ncbi:MULTISPECIES: HEAT repeat domain-containing protein [Pseudanabaena]|uniref:PBS lyase HEAT domain protein repeat-containing protein n=2 Tax=Pseudanabaena TaxID=1152 RepID=L8N0R9_9CYAN|nr:MULTISPECIES: HEAT repeat domain-containing protein [Pseudanabaena]ELS33782.1 PBS lyase HEAT domain protein repeat-containing protein [Pseudanabaena biceps PCC 7429]MDG3494004.1 HEAT repeat domain-containing protein [Pseudanabaena catenata USMAC16]